MALRIRQSLDLQQILDTTVAEVRQFLPADRVFISYFMKILLFLIQPPLSLNLSVRNFPLFWVG